MHAMGADQGNDWHALAASALEWWNDAGVDTFVEDAPRDWLARPAPIAAPPAVEPPPAQAALPDTLEGYVAWRGGDAPLDSGWSDVRFVAEGDPASGLMIVVDCPDEDGIATGATGRLLDRMLAAIGRNRDSIYLATMCAARPLAGRITPENETALAPLLRHHIALAAPRRVLLTGGAASRALLGADAARSRGSFRDINLNGVRVGMVVTFPLRVLLDRPAAKGEAWKDLQLLMGEMD